MQPISSLPFNRRVPVLVGARSRGIYVQFYDPDGRRSGVTAQALAPVLGYLRSVQVVPAQGRPVPATPLEALLAVYWQYLEGERGLSASTIRHYLR